MSLYPADAFGQRLEDKHGQQRADRVQDEEARRTDAPDRNVIEMLQDVLQVDDKENECGLNADPAERVCCDYLPEADQVVLCRVATGFTGRERPGDQQ